MLKYMKNQNHSDRKFDTAFKLIKIIYCGFKVQDMLSDVKLPYPWYFAISNGLIGDAPLHHSKEPSWLSAISEESARVSRLCPRSTEPIATRRVQRCHFRRPDALPFICWGMVLVRNIVERRREGSRGDMPWLLGEVILLGGWMVLRPTLWKYEKWINQTLFWDLWRRDLFLQIRHCFIRFITWKFDVKFEHQRQIQIRNPIVLCIGLDEGGRT